MTKAKFTIERISRPQSPNRFLGTADNGNKVWTTAGAEFDVFDSRRAAETYRSFRMARHAEDCFVAKHAVH